MATPELHRSSPTPVSPDHADEVAETLPDAPGASGAGAVPPENRPGHRPRTDQDKPRRRPPTPRAAAAEAASAERLVPSVIERPLRPAAKAVGATSRKVLDLVEPVTAAAFRVAARLRGARAFHPQGRSFTATARLLADPAPPGFPIGEHRAIVRLSRGAGLPEVAPDVLGIGLRLLDAGGPGRHQDLLMTSAWPSVAGRHVLRPGRFFTSGEFSTLLPYEAGGERVVFGARVTAGGTIDLAGAADLVGAGEVIELLSAGRGDRWRVIGHVQLDGERTEEEDRQLDLDPFRTLPDLPPVGWLNELRRPAYAASRRGRADAEAAADD